VNQGANAPARVVLSLDEGETVWLRKLGIRFMIGGARRAPDRATSPRRSDAHPRARG
jgi:hypothetical protein